jgi:phytoene dehydrogenase-like protein
VRHEFESRHVQAFLLWQAFQTLVSVDLPGSGALAYSIVYGRQQRSWTLPRGGSGRLTDSLVRVIEGEGGTVVCGRTVTRLLVEGGRCAGVETDDGERWLARDAVVSTIHVKHLLEMADEWPESFRYGVETFDVGIPAFVVYLATTAAPFPAVSSGLAGWPEDLVRACREMRDGRFVRETPWLLVGTPTLVDPGRAPEGRHTVKLITPQGSSPPPGFADWPAAREAYAEELLGQLRRFVPEFTEDVIEATLVRSPPDIEAANAHMIGGTFHGGDRGIPFSGALRPAPGWAQHRMPIPGLYQTGGTTHPGGSITGGPGRNAAIVLLQDLGTSLEEVLEGAGRPRAGRH